MEMVVMKGDNRSFWQRMSLIYAKFMSGAEPTYKAVCERVGPELDSGMEVLELACGTGQLSYPLAGRVRRWIASDFSSMMLQKARGGGPWPEGLCFEPQDATAISYPDGSFDAVVMANALHIMPYPEKALAECRRVLKDDGALYVPTFVKGVTKSNKLRTRLIRLMGLRVFHNYDSEGLCQTVADAGFNITEREMMGSALMPLCYVKAVK